MRISKYNFKSKSLDSFVVVDNKLTAFKLLKTPNEEQAQKKFKLAASMVTGEILLYDLNLNLINTVQIK